MRAPNKPSPHLRQPPRILLAQPGPTYPRDAASRAAIRAHYLQDEQVAATLRAGLRGRSLKCAGIVVALQHADTPGGCTNDGLTCLCECHDVKRQGDE